jgi:hypothetical protein
MIILAAGVNGLITITEDRVCEATCAFFRGSIHRFEKYLKSHFFVLIYHLGEAGFIDGEPFFPAFFFEFFFPGHFLNISNPPKSPFSKCLPAGQHPGFSSPLVR